MTEVIEHLTTDGDRWDLLAWRYYGDPLAYEAIIVANAKTPPTPILPGGLIVNIPLRAEASAATNREDLPPWLR